MAYAETVCMLLCGIILTNRWILKLNYVYSLRHISERVVRSDHLKSKVINSSTPYFKFC